jgi:hypothetical protein
MLQLLVPVQVVELEAHEEVAVVELVVFNLLIVFLCVETQLIQ